MLDINRYMDTDFSRRHAMHARRLPIYTSRGCPYNCIFCAIHSVCHHTYRTRDPETVLDEIEMLVAKDGVREIAFYDDNLNANRNHFNAILDGMIERNLDIRWSTPYGISIWLLNEQLIDKCRRSGCYKIQFSIETGSKKTQEFIRKTQIDLDRAKQLIKYCNSLGIWTHANFMMGFIFETREDILKTVEYAIDCDVDIASFRIAVPYPGSDLYEVYRENGLLPSDVDRQHPDRWLHNHDKSSVGTCYLSRDDIDSLYSLAISRFRRHQRQKFLNPFYVAKKMRSWDDIRYVVRVLPIGLRLLRR